MATPTNSASPYPDTPTTEPHQTRLIELLPSTDPQSQLTCRISVLDLEFKNGQTYEALSYTWGEKTESSTIVCNGHGFTVTRNLESALRVLRLSDRIRNLWVDQICINQGDLVERSHQVAIMGDIYRNAGQNLVWLGEAADGSDEAMGLIHYLLDAWKKYCQSHPGRSFLKYYGKLRIPKESDPRWEQLGMWFARPWWGRIWIIQEISLARNVTVHCGNMSCSWNDIRDFARFSFFGTWLDRFVPEFATKFLKEGFLWVWTIELIDSSPEDGLLYHMRRTENHHATEPRDRIFALLSLAPECKISPDYTKPQHEILQTVVKEIIRSSQSLEILESNFAASGESRAQYSWKSGNEDLLSVYASFLDEVVPEFGRQTWVLSINDLESEADLPVCMSDAMPLLHHASILAQHCRPELPVAAATKRFRRTLTQQPQSYKIYPDIKRHNQVMTMKKLYETTVCRMPGFNQRPRGGQVSSVKQNCGTVAQCIELEALREEYVDKDFKLSVILLTDAGRHMHFLLTEKYRIGWISYQAQPGDKRVAIHGCRVPFTVRKCGEHWQLTGTCFIDGLMHGEAFQDGSMPPFEYITLC